MSAVYFGLPFSYQTFENIFKEYTWEAFKFWTQQSLENMKSGMACLLWAFSKISMTSGDQYAVNNIIFLK